MRRVFLAWFTFALLATLVKTASACATASTILQNDDPIQLNSESAFIIWNPTTKTESFIRSANFETKANGFGFLVPTPGVPKITASDPAALETVYTATLSKQLHGTLYHPSSIFFPRYLGDTARHVLSSVAPAIVAEQEVAGLDAVTLAAKNTSGLGVWFIKNGLSWNSDLARWLRPYIARGWMINAFRYIKPNNADQNLSTQLIDMTFQTDTPYFPYSEPTYERTRPQGERLLSVFMLSPERMNGRLAQNPENVRWPGYTSYAAPLSEGVRSGLISQLNVAASQLPSGWWLTAFRDTSSPRPGVADLIFERSTDQSKQTPPAIDNRTDAYFPIEFVTIPLFVLSLIARRRVGWPRREVAIRNVIIVTGYAGFWGNIVLIALIYIGGLIGLIVQTLSGLDIMAALPKSFDNGLLILFGLAGVIYGARSGWKQAKG